MDKLKMKTPNLADGNFAALVAMFPNAVTETVDENGEVVRAIDADVLAQEINTHVVSGKEERYQFTWPDKKKSVLLANAPIAAALRPCREESVDFDNTENLYIEGDNLDVLKLLRETYLNRVKMIYIDPPYNTGNDFVYEDDFSEDTDEFLIRDGQYDEQGNRLTPNLDSNGRFHTDWLNMIYPRLRVARDLLSDDGVIFISIDDNEVENLKKICNEIFGSMNFINQIAWVNNITGRQISGHGAAKTYEYILVYAKNVTNIPVFTVPISFAKEVMPDTYKGFNKDIRTDDLGEFAVGDTLYNHNRIFNEETRPNLVFSIYFNPNTGEIIPDDIGISKSGFIELPPHKNGDGTHKYHAWRWSRQKIVNESYDLIVLPTASGGYEIYTKIRAFTTTILKDLITNISNGDKEFKQLFDGKKCFDYPKSIDLLKTLLGTIPITEDDIILDFFSGSATTAHAVMQLNAEDGGKRKFIMAQLPELTDEKSEAYKAGYKNICEIGKERIRRAGKKIKEDNKDKPGIENLDTGFRVLKLDSSNMKDVYYTPEEYAQMHFNLDGFMDNIKPDRSDEDLLFQVMLELGIPLSAKIKQDGKTFYVNDNYLIACFGKTDTALITEIAKKKPYYAVFRDSSFISDSAMVNFEQVFSTYSPKTIRRVL